MLNKCVHFSINCKIFDTRKLNKGLTLNEKEYFISNGEKFQN